MYSGSTVIFLFLDNDTLHSQVAEDILHDARPLGTTTIKPKLSPIKTTTTKKFSYVLKPQQAPDLLNQQPPNIATIPPYYHTPSSTTLPPLPPAVTHPDNLPIMPEGGDYNKNSILSFLKLSACNIYGRVYRLGRIIDELSSTCTKCKCTHEGVQCQALKC